MIPLISVIVPVYRVESYLAQCVESIQKQTYPNIEIILVDDGSPDQCPCICDNFARADKRIRVIHKENGGLADARNAGTKIAQGQYITYIDSDDWVHKEMLQIMYDILQWSNADIAICGYRKVKGYYVIGPDYKGKRNRTYSKKEILEKVLYQKINNSAWGMLLPAELCKKLLFPVGRLYEDLFLTYKYFVNCKRAVYTPQKLYFYRQTPQSIMHQNFSEKTFDLIDAADEIYEWAKEAYPDLLMAAASRKFSAYAQVFRKIPKQTQNEDLLCKSDKLWSFLKDSRLTMMLDRKARMKNRIAACCIFLGPTVFRSI